ncbi:MAG: TAXI family TRAP transporter solute-binding subunit [Rhodospirillaceae bacterium]|nr:TAXI family TRAP transporter solute-binding subunit [Rhodospirillaceae bacterium]
MNKTVIGVLCAVGLALGFLPAPAEAATQITLKSAKTTSSYYMMMVQLAEMMKKASKGEIVPTVEESQGSVQNVKESFVRPGNFLFTAPPSLIADARAGNKPFAGQPHDTARALFLIPGITVHFVVRTETGITSIPDLAGHTFVSGGKGTFCEKSVTKALNVLGLTDKVKVEAVELSAASSAMRNGKIDGFATCSAHPTPQLVELATTNDLTILSFTDAERDAIIKMNPMYAPLTLPAGTYKGQDKNISTLAMPVGAYGTAAMDDKTAYTITKTFWEWKSKLAADNPWWKGVTKEMVPLLGAKVHPGAATYYAEIGLKIPDSMK